MTITTLSDLRSAIERVCAYNLQDEHRDYEESIERGDIEPGDEAHIYITLRALSAWVDSGEDVRAEPQVITIDLTAEQLRAALDVIGVRVSETNEHGTPLARAEYLMDSALLAYENRCEAAPADTAH